MKGSQSQTSEPNMQGLPPQLGWTLLVLPWTEAAP